MIARVFLRILQSKAVITTTEHLLGSKVLKNAETIKEIFAKLKKKPETPKEKSKAEAEKRKAQLKDKAWRILLGDKVMDDAEIMRNVGILNWYIYREKRKALIMKALLWRFQGLKAQLKPLIALGVLESPLTEKREREILSNAYEDLLCLVSKWGKKPLIDKAIFSSSWCHSGVWQAYQGVVDNVWSFDNWKGTLQLTTKILFPNKYRWRRKGLKYRYLWTKRNIYPSENRHDGWRTLSSNYKIGKTYTFQNLNLLTWLLMKSAVGSFGTGAGSVFWRTYLRGNSVGAPLNQPYQKL